MCSRVCPLKGSLGVCLFIRECVTSLPLNVLPNISFFGTRSSLKSILRSIVIMLLRLCITSGLQQVHDTWAATLQERHRTFPNSHSLSPLRHVVFRWARFRLQLFVSLIFLCAFNEGQFTVSVTIMSLIDYSSKIFPYVFLSTYEYNASPQVPHSLNINVRLILLLCVSEKNTRTHIYVTPNKPRRQCRISINCGPRWQWVTSI